MASIRVLENPSYLTVNEVSTNPIDGQKPGTSGLRKKTRVFISGHYLHNFVQSIFNTLPAKDVQGCTLVIGGDGRYFTQEAVQIITKIAVANGVSRLWIGQNGTLSTPAVSAVVREREGGAAYGAILLTASHNPGGIDEDFGIKYNVSNGGPAPESVTDAIYSATKTITSFKICNSFPDIDLSVVGTTVVKAPGGVSSVTVEVIDPVDDYAALLQKVFDFPRIRNFIATNTGASGKGFKIAYDAMNGVAGPYATRLLGEMLGVSKDALKNCEVLPDFGGHHPDPNLTYASELVEAMGLLRDGTINPAKANDPDVPDFGAAQDGDADRNMVLGRRFFVTPSDSVAIIAANAEAIPFFSSASGAGGLKGVARSMPTSAALDRVAQKRGLALFEVPTGWKFFGNLMDSALLGGPDYCPFLCGEESFGTGSNHVREKDGVWAVLAWLSILAHANEKAQSEGKGVVTVEDIVRAHWREFGRNYYCRYDYEGVDANAAEAMMNHLRSRISTFNSAKSASGTPENYSEPMSAGGFQLSKCDEFRYVDPVDHSVSDKQGLRFFMSDGSRVIFRLSGTGSVGATVRLYLEKFEPDIARHDLPTADVMRDLVAVALSISDLAQFTGRNEPTVIT